MEVKQCHLLINILYDHNLFNIDELKAHLFNFNDYFWKIILTETCRMKKEIVDLIVNHKS
jgi:hypothetical protein